MAAIALYISSTAWRSETYSTSYFQAERISTPARIISSLTSISGEIGVDLSMAHYHER